MPETTLTARTRKLRRNLRKYLDQALDRVETQTDVALAYARKLVARLAPPRARRA